MYIFDINLDRIWIRTILTTRDKNVILWSIETTFKFKHIFILYRIHIIYVFLHSISISLYFFVGCEFFSWVTCHDFLGSPQVFVSSHKKCSRKHSKWNTLNLGNFTHLKEMGDISILSGFCWYFRIFCEMLLNLYSYL